MKIENLKLFN